MAHAHHNAANLLSSDISRRNPQDEYELIQKIGSGTYGDVYKAISGAVTSKCETGAFRSWNLVCSFVLPVAHIQKFMDVDMLS
ncbi:unnamed protein product [Ceratitis capitata]|uniref:(Mediterranean fruit fly) hypothetical protein n=1 Tax=Ceratitis capitata TaxID=7213 RepID=A0A811VDA5_CERCA|nr:unnamed protein product [Ceratitis capitata]